MGERQRANQKVYCFCRFIQKIMTKTKLEYYFQPINIFDTIQTPSFLYLTFEKLQTDFLIEPHVIKPKD